MWKSEKGLRRWRWSWRNEITAVQLPYHDFGRKEWCYNNCQPLVLLLVAFQKGSHPCRQPPAWPPEGFCIRMPPRVFSFNNRPPTCPPEGLSPCSRVPEGFPPLPLSSGHPPDRLRPFAPAYCRPRGPAPASPIRLCLSPVMPSCSFSSAIRQSDFLWLCPFLLPLVPFSFKLFVLGLIYWTLLHSFISNKACPFVFTRLSLCVLPLGLFSF